MTLTCEPLEPRDCPATSYGGGLWVGTHYEARVFADWGGDLNTLRSGDLLYVAPGTGGGPRVAVFDTTTGERARGDWFAADPASRNGVAFVGADIGLSPKSLHAGEPSDFTIFVDFEAGVDPAAFNAAAGLLTQTGCWVTTVRPDLPPGKYGQVVVSSLGWAGGAAGVTVQDWRQTPEWVPKAVYVDGSLSGPWLGKVIAHEVGHAFGLAHRADGTVMDQGYRPGMTWAESDLQQLAAAAALLGG